MSQETTATMQHLFQQQFQIAEGNKGLIKDITKKYQKGTVTVDKIADGKYYVVSSPTLLVDIGSTKFNLLAGTVFIKAYDQIFIMSGHMSFLANREEDVFFRPLREAGFVIESLKGSVALF